MTETLVIGGGLTGLVTAERLQAQGLEVVVLEKEDTPGGACRTEENGSYLFDHTGHLLHIARDETREYFDKVGAWSKLEEHERRAAIYLGGCITPYPIQIHTQGLPPEVRRDCLLGFIEAWAKEGSDPQNFSQWVLDRFGEGLGRHFFFPYNEKLFRARSEDLSLDWVGRYVPKPDLKEVVDGALGLHDQAVGYNARFRYPSEGGIRLLADAVADKVSNLRLDTEVVAINLQEQWVETSAGERLPWDRLVATLALPFLVDRVVGPIPDEVVTARRALRWVNVFNLALGVRGPAARPEHWFYFPEEEFPFYRVGFPSNHGRLAPEDCHTISIEVSLNPEEAIAEDIAETAEAALARIGLLRPEMIDRRLVTVLKPAYVVFDHQRKHAVACLRRFFSGHGVSLAGRWAEWKYSAMEDAVLDGMAVARRLTASAKG